MTNQGRYKKTVNKNRRFKKRAEKTKKLGLPKKDTDIKVNKKTLARRTSQIMEKILRNEAVIGLKRKQNKPF